MKKHVLFAVSLLSASLGFAQAVPNGGFETWLNSNYENPSFMGSSNFNKGGSVYNAIKTSDAFHGAFAVKLTTLSGAANFGYVANGNPGNNASGGIPYNQMAKGIRFYYKSNIVTGDSALVLAEFRKGGVSVGSYIIKIGATKASYTLNATTFSPAMTVAPDTVIFGAASSNAFANVALPGNMLQIDSVSFTGVSSQPANFNGDFESWQALTNYNLPGWNLYAPPSATFQTTDAHVGSFALELTTFQDPKFGNGPQSAQAYSGANGNGLPYTLMSDTLVFFYKYAPAIATDSASVFVASKLAGTFLGGWQLVLGASSTYKMMKLPFSTSSAPDTLLIGINSSNGNNGNPLSPSDIGSVLKIDNMYLKSAPLGVAEIERDKMLSVQPNPNSGSFSLILKGAFISMEKVILYNLNGSIVESREYGNANGTNADFFDISRLPTGLYILQVYTNSGVFFKKISKTN
jgi:hypothetical protein